MSRADCDGRCSLESDAAEVLSRMTRDDWDAKFDIMHNCLQFNNGWKPTKKQC